MTNITQDITEKQALARLNKFAREFNAAIRDAVALGLCVEAEITHIKNPGCEFSQPIAHIVVERRSIVLKL